MSKIKRVLSDRSKTFKNIAEETTSTLGRKRDHTKDVKILDATIDILAEAGYDGMTMDMVAARANTSKMTVYRRWSSKAELVRDALNLMHQNHLGFDLLPDTGTLRGDLLAVFKPQSIEEKDRKLSVMAGLGSFFSHPEFLKVSNEGLLEPWGVINRELMYRAITRREIPAQADIELACEVITSMASYRGLIQRKPIDKSFLAALIDGILLPALKNPQTVSNIIER